MGDIVACPVKSAGLAPADIPFVPLSLCPVRAAGAVAGARLCSCVARAIGHGTALILPSHMTIARKWTGKRFLVGAVTARRRQKRADLTVFLISALRQRDALSLPISD
jgi:hypothetical protein